MATWRNRRPPPGAEPGGFPKWEHEPSFTFEELTRDGVGDWGHRPQPVDGFKVSRLVSRVVAPAIVPPFAFALIVFLVGRSPEVPALAGTQGVRSRLPCQCNDWP